MRVVADKNGVKINNIDIKEWKRVDEMLRAYRVITNGMINSPKQAWATLKKWSKKGLYDYGVSLDLGWKRKDV